MDGIDLKGTSTPLVSIIVPVYNASAYLQRCVDSILSQTLVDWELIFVNDGSTDNSGELCDKICANHSDRLIRVIHKPNGGVASAREIGMQYARGEFSIHIDPDDWIESETLSILHDKAVSDQADMVVYDFVLDYAHSHQEISRQCVCNQDEPLLKQLLSHKLHGSLCNKLIRTDLYRRYNLHFPQEMICWEDLYICCNISLHPCRISYVNRAMYHYDLHSNHGSMTRKATQKTLEAMRSFCSYFESVIPEDKLEWLLPTKAMVLLTAYRCDLLTAEGIRCLYPEVNDWFISTYLRRYTNPMYCALALVLDGCSLSYARRFQAVNNICQRIKNRIKRLI